MAHTRRLSRLSLAAIALVLLTTAGCWDDPVPYPVTGTGGAGRGGGGGGAAGNAAGTGGTAGSAGSSGGGTGDATATGGIIGGSGGSAAGSAGSAGKGGSQVVTVQSWPTSDAVVTVDSMNQFSNNLSDLVYQPPAAGVGDVLWGVQNDPSTLYCLLWNGTTWSAMTNDGWDYGKLLHYPTGLGAPDAEGMARAELSSTAVYVASERDNDAGSVSRMSVLRYDFSGTTTELTATNEWNLTTDLPTSPPNNGIEGITWIPDSYLIANRFFDEAANAVYAPSLYPDHGTGLFFVGHEAGSIYAFALDQSAGTFRRVATIASGQAAVMSLYFDRDVGNLWTYCDNTCGNRASVLRISSGHFVVQYLYDHPTTLPNSNMEGIAIAPESECVGGRKGFFWSDDDDYGGHAIYRGSIPCGPLP